MQSGSEGRARAGARAKRLLLRVVAPLLVLLAPAFAAHAGDRGYEIAPTPAWVLATEPGEATPEHLRRASDGVSYLLVENQVLAAKDRRTSFFRYVSRALNAKGVESAGNLGIDFDPSWQTLQLHAVHVVRDGRVIDKLPGARIEVIQQEKELGDLIYNGSKTVKVFLEDVRVGDIVDYSFSTSGRNPVFGGSEFGDSDLQWGVPVARLRARLLVPTDAAVEVRTRNSTQQPLVLEHDGLREYRWDMRDTRPLTVEEGAPFWYAPFAGVEWSSYPDWASVVRWAQPLYRVPADLGPALEAQARRIAAAEPTPVGRMLAALRFVQHEVRYLGVETGRNTHAPNPPALVFARRFGDCKDKALLTMSLLQRLGVESHAALVNTRSQRAIATHLPNPAAFDHVIVQARIGGRSWWLDPTRPMQESDADHLYQPDWGLGLVVAPQTRALVSMKNDASRSRRRVHLLFDARASFSGPVGLQVVTVYEGGAAEAQRDELAGDSLETVQDDYLQYYADSYPGIRVAAPMRVVDDKRFNRLTTTEDYSITGIAGKADANGKHTVWIETPDVDELLADPEAKLRKAPLGLQYPLEVSSTTEVLLPAAWSISESDARVQDPAFFFRRSVHADPGQKRFVIQDDYRTLADEVAAREMPRYTANLAKARGQLGYSLFWTDTVAPPPAASAGRRAAGFGDRFNWPLGALALFALAAFVQLARRAWRIDPAPRGQIEPGFAGIRGWLLPYSLAVPALPLLVGYRLWLGASAYGSIAWSALTTYGGAHYDPLWAPFLLVELLVQLLLLVASLLALGLFWRRRSSYPRCALALYIALSVFMLADLLLASRLPAHALRGEDFAGLVEFVLGAGVCCAYLARSRRVRATFVRRLDDGLLPARDETRPQAVQALTSQAASLPRLAAVPG